MLALLLTLAVAEPCAVVQGETLLPEGSLAFAPRTADLVDSEAAVASLACALSADPELELWVGVHTDSRGSSTYNLEVTLSDTDRNLTNTLVVVIRYFGGTKLGIGGLIDAYREAAAQALEKAGSKPFIPMKSIHITFPYSLTSEVSRVVNQYDIEVTEAEFTAACHQKLTVRESDYARVREIFNNLGIIE